MMLFSLTIALEFPDSKGCDLFRMSTNSKGCDLCAIVGV